MSRKRLWEAGISPGKGCGRLEISLGGCGRSCEGAWGLERFGRFCDGLGRGGAGLSG